MEAPDDLWRRDFDTRLKRGLILRTELGPDVLSDPNRPRRTKFFIIVSAYCPDDDVWFVLTTSQTSHLDKNPRFERESIRIAGGQYQCFPAPVTVIDASEVHKMPLRALRERYKAKQLTFCGELTVAHLQQLDDILRRSHLINPAQKRWILPDV